MIARAETMPRNPHENLGDTREATSASVPYRTSDLLSDSAYVGKLIPHMGHFHNKQQAHKGRPLCYVRYLSLPSLVLSSLHPWPLGMSASVRSEYFPMGERKSVCGVVQMGIVLSTVVNSACGNRLTIAQSERIHSVRSPRRKANDYYSLLPSQPLTLAALEAYKHTWMYATHIRHSQGHTTYKLERITMVRESLIRKLEAFIGQVRMLDDGMPVQTLACFLAIARREGQSISELAEALGLAQSSASRNVSALSEWHWQKKPGLDLVETRVDPMELRKKQVVLKPKGKRLVEQIERAFEGGAA